MGVHGVGYVVAPDLRHPYLALRIIELIVGAPRDPVSTSITEGGTAPQNGAFHVARIPCLLTSKRLFA